MNLALGGEQGFREKLEEKPNSVKCLQKKPKKKEGRGKPTH